MQGTELLSSRKFQPWGWRRANSPVSWSKAHHVLLEGREGGEEDGLGQVRISSRDEGRPHSQGDFLAKT